MFKIGEFSKITQVSIRMLRYYDEQKLLEPCSIDKISGYRFYSLDQIDVLNRIVLLRDMGFGVKEIKAILDSGDTTKVRLNLLEQKKKIEENIDREKNKLQQIQGFIYDLENIDKKLNIEIVMKQLPVQSVISLRRVVSDYYCEGNLWKEFGDCLKEMKGLDYLKTLPSFSIYHDLDYREKDVDIEICIVMNDVTFDIENKEIVYRQVDKVDKAACFMVYGDYSNISFAYKEFAYWLDKHKEYKMIGENRQICHVSMNQTTNKDEYVTELQIPLKYIG